MWNEQQTREFAKQVMKDWQSAIPFVSAKVLRAACAEKALNIITMQASESISPDACAKLHGDIERAVFHLAGLDVFGR